MTKRALAGAQGDLRQGNLAAILNHLREDETVTRTTLAQLTGLNRATITRLVRDLIDNGFVHENGLQASTTGRPAIPLALNSDAGMIIGAEIGFDSITAIVTDFKPAIVWRQQVEVDLSESLDTIIERACAIFGAACDYARQQAPRLFGLGLGLPGLVDTQSGTLLFAPNLHWNDVPIRHILEDCLTIPVFVDNVASASALGESYFGAAQDYNNVLYLSTQGGLGGRFVINGNILRGAGGFAGEVGHMTISDTGRRCNCGRIGCWETLASQVAVLQRVREHIEAGEASSLKDMVAGDLSKISIPMMVEAARAGDAVASEVLHDTGHWLGVGLANLINAFNPDLVVIGGILSLAHEFLLPEIEAVIAREPLRWLRESCEIAIAEHKADAVLMGGVATVYRDVIENPHHWI